MSTDPHFGVQREALLAAASDPDSDEILQAAVALIVRGDVDLEVLLIKRARREGDLWSGHMALPGGRRDPATPLFYTRRCARIERGRESI